MAWGEQYTEERPSKCGSEINIESLSKKNKYSQVYEIIAV
jgi:hypothetical protein